MKLALFLQPRHDEISGWFYTLSRTLSDFNLNHMFISGILECLDKRQKIMSLGTHITIGSYFEFNSLFAFICVYLMSGSEQKSRISHKNLIPVWDDNNGVLRSCDQFSAVQAYLEGL